MSDEPDEVDAEWLEINNATLASIYEGTERSTISRRNYTHDYIFDFSDMFYMVVSLGAPEK